MRAFRDFAIGALCLLLAFIGLAFFAGVGQGYKPAWKKPTHA